MNGVDMCFIGPNDLHLALGYPAMFWSAEPRFVQAIERVKESLPAARHSARNAVQRCDIREGSDGVMALRFIGLGSDAHFVLQFAGMQYGELHGVLRTPRDVGATR